MALEAKDSADIAKAIVSALDKAMKTMGGGSRAVGGGATPRNEATSDRSQKNEDSKNKKTILATSAALNKLEGAANDSANSLSGFNKRVKKADTGLGNLGGSLGKTVQQLSLSRAELRKINFGSVADDISKAMEKAFASGMKDISTDSNGTKVSPAAKAIGDFAQMVDSQVNPRLAAFRKSISASTKALMNLARGVPKQRGGVKATAEKPMRVSDVLPTTAPKKEKEEKEVNKFVGPRGGKRPPTGTKVDTDEPDRRSWFQRFTRTSDTTYGSITKSLQVLKRTGIDVVDDAFQVMAARGYGVSAALGTNGVNGLYGAAISAGMSLRDYAKFMDENMIAVSRASSFAEFQKNLSVATDGLAKFGIFGDDAAKLAGTMMSASTSLGIPQEKLGDAVSAQTAVFEKLRKTTAITADQFAELTKALADDFQVRTELSALSGPDRIARQQEILQQAAYAKSLNLSTAEQQKYTQSVLEQRKSTVKQRFQQAGRLTQAAGLLGMGADDVQELRGLAMNRYKTDEQQQRYNELLANVNTGLESMQQSGQPGSQYQSDTIRGFLDESGLGNQIDAASAVQAAKQSGPVKNKDLGQELGVLNQSFGKFIALFSGFMQNPLGSGLAQLASIAASTAASIMANRANTMAIVAAIEGSALAGAAGNAAEGIGGAAGKAGGKMGMLGRVAGTALMVAPAVINGISSLGDLTQAQKDKKEGKEGANEAEGKAIGEGIGGTAGAALGLVLSGFIGAFTGGLGLAATGIITSITTGLGAWAGGLLGGWLKRDTAAEKQTKEIEKNTAELVEIRRKGMPVDTIAVEKLDTISQNVLASAKAATTPTSAEVAAHMGLTPATAGPNAPAATAGPDMVEQAIYDPLSGVQIGTTMVPAGTPSVKPAGNTGIAIATPAAQTQTKVNQGTVNTAVNDAQTDQALTKTLAAATQTAAGAVDPADVLQKILMVLQQSLSAENQQVDLVGQLLRANALVPTLPDNQVMTERALRAH